MRRVLDWYGPATAGALAVATLAVGFALATAGRFGERLGPAPAGAASAAPPAGTYHVVALGDSITAGTGDVAGRGYAGRVADALRRRGLQIGLVNLAVPGDETADLLRVLAGEHARREVAAAQDILVSVGGNDLAHSLRGETEDLEGALAKMRTNLRDLVTRLRALNRTAAIRLVGLYNPFEVEPSAEARARAMLLDWNIAIERAALEYRDVLAVPVADLFAGRPDRLAGDQYHPGTKGHEAIAERVLSTLAE